MEASFANENCLGPCSQSALYRWCKTSLTHTLPLQLSQLSGICGPLSKTKAKVYVGATPEVSWGKQMERTGYDSSSLWKPPDS